MALVPFVAWLVAVVLAIVLLGYCAYELLWKTKRLRQDLGQLQTLAGQLHDLQTGLADSRARFAAAQGR